MLQRLSSLLLAVLAVAGLCCSSVSAQAGSGWQLYSFCYVTQNTLATSPYLLWSAYAQGTMNISTQASAGSYRFGTFNGSLQAQPTTGYAVYGITGFREVYAQGKALQSNQILGLVPVGAYGSNDNLINTTAPYFAAPHAVSFYLDGIAQYANGPAVYPNALRGSPNVTINGFRETGAASASFANAFSEGDQPTQRWSDQRHHQRLPAGAGHRWLRQQLRGLHPHPSLGPLYPGCHADRVPGGHHLAVLLSVRVGRQQRGQRAAHHHHVGHLHHDGVPGQQPQRRRHRLPHHQHQRHAHLLGPVQLPW